MATLASTLKQNKPLLRGQGGVLTEETPEELQSLSAKVGLASPPLTPLGAAGIGANPDQQKMVGTPAQKQSALSLAQQSADNSLADALRRQQVRSTATDQEAAASQKSEEMQKLGGLGDRVNDMVNAQRKRLGEQGAAGVPGVEVQSVGTGKLLSGGPAVDLVKHKDMLANLRKDPGNQDLMMEVNRLLGADINRQLTPEEINGLYESSVQSLARGAAGSVDNSLTVQDLASMKDFGYDLPTLSNLLGIDQTELANLKVGQLRDKINQVADQEFSSTQGLEQQATSGNLGAAERGLARQGAMESSRVGTRSSEADVASMEQQIANADKVTFAGQTMGIDELLSDDTVSGMVAEYYQNPDFKKQLDATEPEFSKWLAKNQALLQDASSQLSGGATAFHQTQEFNKNIAVAPFGGVPLDDSIAKALIPGFGKMQARKIDVNSVPILKQVAARGPEYGKAMATAINTGAKEFPELTGDLGQMTYDQLNYWDVGNPTGTFRNSYIGDVEKGTGKRFYKAVETANPADLPKLLSYAYGNIGNPEGAQGTLNANRAANALGYASKINSGMIDANGDGIIDSGAEIQKALLGKAYNPSLLDSPDKVKDSQYGRPALESPQVPSNPADKAIFDKLAGAALKGSVNYEDLSKAGITVQEAARLKQTLGNNPDVQKKWTELRTKNTQDRLQEAGDDLDKVNDLVNNSDGEEIDKASIQWKLDQLMNQEANRQKAEEIRGRKAATERKEAREAVSSTNPFAIAKPFSGGLNNNEFKAAHYGALEAGAEVPKKTKALSLPKKLW